MEVGVPRSARVGEVDHAGTDAECLAAVAAVLEGRLATVTADVQDAIVRAIPGLVDDPQLAGLREASVAENVSAMVHMMRLGIDSADVVAPMAALEYARRNAHRATPAALLVRCYRAGQARFLRHGVEELSRQGSAGRFEIGPASILLFERISEYIDRVLEQVLQAYEQTRDRHLQTRSAVLASRVRSVVDGGSIHGGDIATALGYRVNGDHLGMVLWLDDADGDGDGDGDADPIGTLSGLATAVARAVGRSDDLLFVPVDDRSAWVWVPCGLAEELDRGVLARTVTDWKATVSAAYGEPGSGVEGFRRTHRQALGAHSVASVASPGRARVVPFAEVAPIVLLCADVDAARAWVDDTLGALAADSARHEMLRETALVYLATGGSYLATADRLFVHRNTAQYRVRKAEVVRGRSLRDGRLEVELALLACHWLGRTVLARS